MKRVLVKPIITEKSMQLANKGWFTFEVEKTATKHAIRQTLQDQFKVHVVDIRTITVKGKLKRRGRRRMEVIETDSKKALARLKENEKIDLFPIEKTGEK